MVSILTEKLTRLGTVKVHKGQLQAITIDKKAIVNVETIGPKRKMIVILSFSVSRRKISIYWAVKSSLLTITSLTKPL